MIFFPVVLVLRNDENGLLLLLLLSLDLSLHFALFSSSASLQHLLSPESLLDGEVE